MKKIVFILGGVFFLLFIFTFAFMWWIADTLTGERNKNKIKKAQELRWVKPTPNGQQQEKEIEEPTPEQKTNEEAQ